MTEYIASLNPAVQSFVAAGFCAAALLCLTYTGVLTARILDKISDRFVKRITLERARTLPRDNIPDEPPSVDGKAK